MENLTTALTPHLIAVGGVAAERDVQIAALQGEGDCHVVRDGAGGRWQPDHMPYRGMTSRAA